MKNQISKKLALATLALVMGGAIIAPPAKADDDRGRDGHYREMAEHRDNDRGQRDYGRGRERYEHDHERRRVWRDGRWDYYNVYSPPVVVYPPPEPSPGLNFIIPLNIR